jgi:predicted TIM-barrel fold metal-dependent hydrolase
MLRRDILKAGAAIAAASLHGPFATSTSSAQTAPSLIDAHAHIFNADDLPILEFIDKIQLPHLKDIPQNGSIRESLRYFIVEIAEWARKRAPNAVSPATEADRALRPPSPELELLRKFETGEARPFTPAQRAARDRAHAIELIALIRDGGWQSARTRRGDPGGYVRIFLMQQLHEAADPKRQKYTRWPYNSPESWESAESLAFNLLAEQGTFSTLLRWGLLFAWYRHELAEELAGKLDGRASLIVPALVDYSIWLEDPHDVRLDDQIAVMGAIARRSDKPGLPRVHGYAPFCPLREVLFRIGKEPSSALERVKRAVLQDGFLGVKLYPPMGYRALGNGRLRDSAFLPFSRRSKLGLSKIGEKLDAALGDLYAWCAENEVPIMAHGAHSNGISEAFMNRAAPEFWGEALTAFPKLRVMLAHFGDFEPPPGSAKGLARTWEYRIARLMTRHPTLYADISYFHTIFKADNHGEYREMLRRFGITANDFEGLLQTRLVFGSDWIMLGNEAGLATLEGNTSSYPRRVAQTLRKVRRETQSGHQPITRPKTEPVFDEEAIRRIFQSNAVAFLGLGPEGRPKGNRQRLEAFYAGHPGRNWVNQFGN